MIYLGAFARDSYETPVRVLENMSVRQNLVWSGNVQLLTEDV